MPMYPPAPLNCHPGLPQRIREADPAPPYPRLAPQVMSIPRVTGGKPAPLPEDPPRRRPWPTRPTARR